MILLCDLDGVVWLAHEPIAGSVEAIKEWTHSGHEVVFVTNNSFNTVSEQEQFLSLIGIEAGGRVVSSANAAGSLLGKDERVLVIGGQGIVEAAKQAGALVYSADAVDQNVDTVVVGLDREFNYEKLRVATQAVRSGARLVGTNSDPTYPTPNGQIPGGGALVSAVSYASETIPVFAGKPFAPMFECAMQCAASLVGREVDLCEVLVVGDRLDTDGAFANNAGVDFGLVLSGVTRMAPSGAFAFLDLADLVATKLREING